MPSPQRTEGQERRNRLAQLGSHARGRKTDYRVAGCLADGNSLRETAALLDMSYDGVKLSLQRIRVTLGAWAR